MNIYTYKPTSAGVRNKVSIKNNISNNKFYNKNLYKIIKYNAGRDKFGNITVRHKGGRLKRKYRLIDFYRNKYDVYGKVCRFDYDPYRNALIVLIIYYDGEKRYILSPKTIEIGDVIISGFDIPIKIGNSLLIKHIPEGTKIHCLESRPGSGAKYIRSAGTSGILVSKKYKFAYIMLKSGKLKKFDLNCRATIGEVGNEKFNLLKRGKAGASRLIGIRPTVRGVAMNPIDHPHGGGEGKTSGGRDPVTPWGICTKGFKTRKL